MRNKGISLLIPILFLCMLGLIFSVLLQQEQGLSRISFRAEGQDMSLKPCYDQETEVYYLTLPAFFPQEGLTVSHPWYLDVQIRLGSKTQADLSSIPLDQDFTLTLERPWGREETYTLRLLRCSANQTISIEAQEGILAYIHADQTHERDVFVTILDSAGTPEHRGTATISGRGNSTWDWQKKPYDLDFAEPASVGPFTQVKRLSLLAEYFDLSKLRGALAYHTAQTLDFAYATPYAYADLFINGQYQGLYGLATKREYEKAIDRDGIQGVFELSTSGKGREFTTDMHKTIRIHYGELELIQYKVECMEYALKDQNWAELEQHIDLNSWAQKLVLDEVFYNYDSSLTSQYYYIGPDGRIYSMLPWDYEWVLYPRLSQDMTKEYALCANWNHKNWYQQLLEYETFRTQLSSILRETYTPEFLDSLNVYMAACEAEIQDSWYADQFRWRDAYGASHYARPAQFPISDYRETFSAALPARVAFLEDLFENWENYRLLSFLTQYDSEDPTEAHIQLILPLGSDFSAYHSQILSITPAVHGYEFLGWYAEDGTPMEAISTVSRNLVFTGRYRSQSPENGGTP